jgi:3-oxoacyl-ACP reductase-like protein
MSQPQETRMGLFKNLMDRIFNHKPKAKAAAPAPAAAAATVAAATASATAAVAAAPAPAPEPIDVEALLADMAEDAGQALNWRTSIVDLMKLIGMDSSLANRKELAEELGYGGDMGDSAAMNIWLHKAVMKALSENGGKVPAAMLD